jgi:hypothetical protein
MLPASLAACVPVGDADVGPASAGVIRAVARHRHEPPARLPA